MSEQVEAVRLANSILERINADPDDDIAVLARQFLRLREIIVSEAGREGEAMSESLTVYRIQDATGRGPFRPGFSHVWLDADIGDRYARYKSWVEEFGVDLIARTGKPGEFYGSAVRQCEELSGWFSYTEQRRLKHMGFHIVALDADRILAESTIQVVFARALPLNQSIVIIPWRKQVQP